MGAKGFIKTILRKLAYELHLYSPLYKTGTLRILETLRILSIKTCTLVFTSQLCKSTVTFVRDLIKMLECAAHR